MHKILGIDLGATAVKAVAIEASFRNHALRAYRSEPVAPAAAPVEGELPKTWLERVRPALEALAADDWFRADTIICCLPAAQVATHFVTLPFSDQRRVDQTLPFEIEGLIPFDLEDIVFDSHVLSRGNGKTELLVAVARKEDMQSLLDLFKGVGVDPSVVTFSALALNNLQTEKYLDGPPPAPAPATPPLEAIVDIGAECTNVLVTEGGQVRFARTLAVGGAEVTRSLARVLGLSFAEAEQSKLALDFNGGSEPMATVAAERAVSALVRELRATFSSVQTRLHRKVELIQLSGGGSRLAGLSGFLGDALGVSVSHLALSPAHAFPEPAELAPAALALSLALRGAAGNSAPKLNFRRGAFSFTKTSGEVRGRFGALAAMAAVLLVLLGASAWARLHALEKREAQLDEVLCETTKKIIGRCETDYRVALATLKGRGSPAAAIPAISAVDLLSETSVVFPPGDEAVLTDLDVVDNSVRMRGDAKSYDAVDNLVTDLQKNKCFTDVKKGKLVQGKDTRIEFNIDALYTCSRKAGS